MDKTWTPWLGWENGPTERIVRPEKIVEERGLKQVTDTGAIEAAVDEAIANGTAQVEQYKGGNEKVLGWFVGQVMKATQGKANPQAATNCSGKSSTAEPRSP